MLRVALTGGMATGKSYVRLRVAGRGVPTIDADAVVHELLAGRTDVADAVERRFGSGVRGRDGAVDRRALGRLVFADDGARRDLEAIVHPAVWRRIARWAEDLGRRGARWGLADVPLLFETGRQGDFDRVVVASCAPDVQLRRVVERDGLSEDDARARLATQWPTEDKARNADYVIRTDGTFDDTDRQIDELVARLDREALPRG
jgi:dephospho-CoA kinase